MTENLTWEQVRKRDALLREEARIKNTHQLDAALVTMGFTTSWDTNGRHWVGLRIGAAKVGEIRISGARVADYAYALHAKHMPKGAAKYLFTKVDSLLVAVSKWAREDTQDEQEAESRRMHSRTLSGLLGDAERRLKEAQQVASEQWRKYARENWLFLTPREQELINPVRRLEEEVAERQRVIDEFRKAGGAG